MEVIWIPIIEFLVGAPIVLAISSMKKDARAHDAQMLAREEMDARAEEGRRVRMIVFRAYSAMLKQHAHGLHFLTACLSQDVVAANVAIYALEETKKGLSRFDTRPIQNAINEIKGEGE